MGVEVEYCNLLIGDFVDMVCIIEQVVVSGLNGIIIILFDYDVLFGLIKVVVDSGIDVIIMNFGILEQVCEVGVLMYVGQLEYDVGFVVGICVKGDGVGSFFCVNYYISLLFLIECC